MHELIILIAKYCIVLSGLGLVATGVLLPASDRKTFLLFVIVSAVVTTLLVKLATTLHSDPRPFIRDGAHPYFVSSTDNGFPSDHTVMAAFCAFVVARYRRRWGLALFALAVLIGAARVVSGVHHGQDIVGGLCIAGLGVAFGYYLSKKVQLLKLPFVP